MKIKYHGGKKCSFSVESTVSTELLDAFIDFELCLGEFYEKYAITQEHDEKLRAAVQRIERQSSDDAFHRGMICALLGWERMSELVLENPEEATITID